MISLLEQLVTTISATKITKLYKEKWLGEGGEDDETGGAHETSSETSETDNSTSDSDGDSSVITVSSDSSEEANCKKVSTLH